jgi:Sec-independent protein secretion pathway component TatC
VVHPAAMAKKRRYVYLGGLMALAVVTTTADAFSLGVVAVPAMIFFEGSLLAARVVVGLRRGRALGPAGAD